MKFKLLKLFNTLKHLIWSDEPQQFKPRKHLLASLSAKPKQMIKRLQIIGYLSLLLNIICVVSILMMIFK